MSDFDWIGDETEDPGIGDFEDHDDVGFAFEHESAMDSIGWGDDGDLGEMI